MRRVLLKGFVVIGVAAVVWMLARERSDRSASALPSGPRSEPALTSVELQEPDARQAVARSAMPEPERSNQDASEAGASSVGPTLFVHVVDEHEAPVAGVQVRCIDLEAAGEDSPDALLGGDDLDALAARLGTSFVSDGEGLVRIQKRGAGCFVVGEQDGRTGFAYFGNLCADQPSDPQADESRTLVLREDRALHVRVVDGAGAPVAGIPVAFHRRIEVCDSFRTMTDANGQARIRHLRDLLNKGLVPDKASVVIAMLASPPIDAALRPGPLPSEPIELVLPVTGSLDLQLEDADGRPVDVDALIELEAEPPEGLSADETWERKYIHPRCSDHSARIFAHQGRARIEHIGLGLALDLRVTPMDDHRPFDVRQLGPTSPGEEVIAHLPVAPAK